MHQFGISRPMAGLPRAGGSGFTDKLGVDILRKLRPLETPKTPVPAFPKEGGRWGKKLQPTDTHWVKPKLVAEINLRDVGEGCGVAADFI
jgi:ATP-dependent DNA ligase